MQPISTDHANSNQSQITAIRDILFGNNMQVYETEFANIRNLIAQKGEESEQRQQQQFMELSETISNLEQKLRLQMKKNHEELLSALQNLDQAKADRHQLGKMFIEIGNKISM